MAIIDIIKNKKSALVKDGEILEIKILSSGDFKRTNTYKTKVHKIIGDSDSYQYIGKGEKKIQISIHLDTEGDYQQLLDFIDNGATLLLVSPIFPLTPIKLDGDVSISSYYSGWGIASINFTTALSPEDDVDSLMLYFNSEALKQGETAGDKKSFLDKLNSWADKIGKNISKGNEYVGKVTNNVSAYAAAFTNILTNLSSSSSMVTNPLSTVKSSAQQVLDGLSGLISSMTNTVLAIKQAPNDFAALIDSFSILGDKLNNLFDLGNNNDSTKYNTEFLGQVGISIISTDLSPNNEDIQNNFISTGSNINLDTTPEYFMQSLHKDTDRVMSVLILSSILINLYENAQLINRWNSIDLENLRQRTETIYYYIIQQGIDTEFLLELDLARNRFFTIFKKLYETAYKIVEVDIYSPDFLENIVYSINGNLDFYNETKKINNIIGGIVHSGVIKVISND